jgi:hypothetical protein
MVPLHGLGVTGGLNWSWLSEVDVPTAVVVTTRDRVSRRPPSWNWRVA